MNDGQKSYAVDKEQPNRLLMLLLSAKNNYISGEEVSNKLGVTRSAIWKQVNNLRNRGYEIESSTKKGYRLVSSPDLLLPEEIWIRSHAKVFGRKIYYYTTIDSTNAEAKKLALNGALSGSLVVAEEQTKGKGRLGRAWVSPKGSSISASIILRPDIGPSEAPRFTLLAAVAVAEAVREKACVDAMIKWPNDILIEGKKVCGILTEMSSEPEVINYIIIGIGINVNNTRFPEELKDSATSLKLSVGKNIYRAEILAAILDKMEYYCESGFIARFNEMLKRWKELCCNFGKSVKIMGRKESFEGVAIDVDPFGALLIKKNDGEVVRVLSGDVTLR